MRKRSVCSGLALLILLALVRCGENNPVGPVVTLPGGVTMEFAYIPPGTFMMGSPDSYADAEQQQKPQHQVTISRGFHLGKYAVTQSQWESVMGTRPWANQGDVPLNPDLPATYISWYDAQAFAQTLNLASGEFLYRLPTEAEWEYACRAGTTTPWSFGDDVALVGEYAWYGGNGWSTGLRHPQPVGLKLPNPWGLYDMHGNLFEWVQDWEGSYTSEPKVDPQGPPDGVYRGLRGGSFRHAARHVISAIRISQSPDYRSSTLIGFRLVRMTK